MSETSPKQDMTPDLATVLAEINERLGKMEKTVYRRFDEVSAEVHATSELVGMAEDSIKQNFAEVMEILQAVSFSGDGATPHNTGVELTAVVDITEEAANTIMDKSDQLAATLAQDAEVWEDPTKREASLMAMEGYVQDILMACSFQDITGQRIEQTLKNLKRMEERLSSALEKIGLDPAKAERMVSKDLHKELDTNVESASQDDIDALFD